MATYWDLHTSGHADLSDGGTIPGVEGLTTADLQNPTGYTDDTGQRIYADWDIDTDNADGDNDVTTRVDDPWDFGDANDYPALNVDFDGDGEAAWSEFGIQRPKATQIIPESRSTPPTVGDHTLNPLEQFGMFLAGVLLIVGGLMLILRT